jgi:hypothetical protein
MFLTKKRLRLYLGGLLVLQVIMCLSFLSSVREGYVDLRSYYTAGYLVRTGDAAHAYDYDTEKRIQSTVVTPNAKTALLMFAPPFTALLFAPLTLAPFRIAFLIFFAVNLLLLALVILAMRPQLESLSQRWRPFPALLFLSFLPVGFTLMMGQISIMLLLLYCLCYIANQKDKPFVAGLLLSLALMKFQIALPAALLFLAWRQWRFFSGFLVGATALTALSAWIIGIGNFLPYLRSLLVSSHAASTDPSAQADWAIYPYRMPNLYGLFISLSGGAHWGMTLTILASALLIVWAIFQRPSLPLALLTGLLVSYHLYICDLTLLLLPLSLIANQALSETGSVPALQNKFAAWRRLGAISAASFLLITPLNVFLITYDVTYLFAVPIAIMALTQADWTSPGRSKTQAAAEPSLPQLAPS